MRTEGFPTPGKQRRTMELTPLLEERLGESEGRDKAMITRIRPTLTTDNSDYQVFKVEFLFVPCFRVFFVQSCFMWFYVQEMD